MFPAYRPSDTVFKITFWLGYFNSCINPIIYPLSSLEFKKAFQSLLGAHCLRITPKPPHHLSPGLGHSQVHGHPLTLGLDSRGDPSHLSPSSSYALSRTPSPSPSRDGREWRGLSETSGTGPQAAAETGRAKAAKLCSKSLLKTCFCIQVERTPSHEAHYVQPPPSRSLPTIKIHQLSLCENGEPV